MGPFAARFDSLKCVSVSMAELRSDLMGPYIPNHLPQPLKTQASFFFHG